MGTRADFYVGRGAEAEWIGSIAWDGYPDGIPESIKLATGEQVYRTCVEAFFAQREDVTRPDQGWPWPWDDSHTSDYAYAFDDGRVYHTTPGGKWWPSNEPEPDYDEVGEVEGPRAVFPNMKSRKNVTLGKRSGVMVIG